MRRIFSVFILSLLIVISISGCLGEEEIITTPAIDMILNEDDFENNWTSWWVIHVKNASIPPYIDTAYAWLTHYSQYPIDEDHRDLECVINLFVYSSIENATEIFHNISATILMLHNISATSTNLTSYSIGDEGFYLRGYIQDPGENFVLHWFRIKNVLVTMEFELIGDGLDPMDARIVSILKMQESKVR